MACITRTFKDLRKGDTMLCIFLHLPMKTPKLILEYIKKEDGLFETNFIFYVSEKSTNYSNYVGEIITCTIPNSSLDKPISIRDGYALMMPSYENDTAIFENIKYAYLFREVNSKIRKSRAKQNHQ